RLAVPGRPILYRTTQNFLRSFGLASLEELPELPNASGEDGQITMEMQAAVERLKAEQEAVQAAEAAAAELTEEEIMAAAEEVAAQEAARGEAPPQGEE
ncbi:MAG: SMC-Scp complex subunit ScpB, partial [Pseudoflavonifractor sp.]